ncbi:sortase [Paenibacillus rigui]|uniref:Sortase n=2 Tax=Paenibacillus rigui TaxID=554312 RepID=A0A229UJD7_9BACL|nr:sortase [Paenibacillus rigui]
MLFAVGIIFMLQPWWERNTLEKQRLAILDGWDTQQQAISSAMESRELQQLQPVTLSHAGKSAPSEPQVKPIYLDGYAVLGTLSIEKLNLREPVLKGADPESLKVGVGLVETDRKPGRTGNVAIAGHRSWTFGKQFSRLNELATKDRIVLSTTDQSYEYVVTSTFLVEPDDLSVLESTKDKAELTLITCEPKYNPTHRLIVKAELIKTGAKE